MHLARSEALDLRRSTQAQIECFDLISCPYLLAVTIEVHDTDALTQSERHHDSDVVIELSNNVVLGDSAAFSNGGRLQRTFGQVIEDAHRLREEQHLLLKATALAFIYTLEAIRQDPTGCIDLLMSSYHLAHKMGLPTCTSPVIFQLLALGGL